MFPAIGDAAVATWQWLLANTPGNLAASAICFVIAWFWKIRPHLKAQAAHRLAEKLHREHVKTQLAALHEAVKACD